MHVVLIRFKSDIKEDHVQKWIDYTKQLPDKISGIETITIGTQDAKVHDGYVDRSQGFTHSVAFVFPTTYYLRQLVASMLYKNYKEAYITPFAEEVIGLEFAEKNASDIITQATQAKKQAPVVHIVAFKMKKETKAEVSGQLQAEFANMNKTIPGLLSVVFHARDSKLVAGLPDASQGWTHLLFSVFADGDALRAYQSNADHVNTKTKLIAPNIEDILALDFVFPDHRPPPETHLHHKHKHEHHHKHELEARHPLECPPPRVVG